MESLTTKVPHIDLSSQSQISTANIHLERLVRKHFSMCRLLKLQYDCSTDGEPHYLENAQGASIPCHDRHACLIEDTLVLKPGSDTSPPSSPIERDCTTVKIGGDCEKCANKKAKKLEEEDKVFVEATSIFGRTERDLDGMLRRCGEIAVSNRRRRLNYVRSEYRPNDTCSSGSCPKEVHVSHAGVKGMFCRKHTCSAHKFDCLTDVSTTRNGPQHSIYCPRHTCSRSGCGLQVMDEFTPLCKRHHKELELYVSALR